ncbi:MAG: hypothetical protein H6Q02_615 [Acidobacteria bacterium]|nr:hypothetical protein [Acidobacteriota bacterium]
MVLAGREDVLLAVDRAAGRGEDDLAQRAAPAALEQVDCAAHVDVGVEQRVGDRAAHVDLRRVVDQHLDAGLGDERGRPGRPDVEHVEFGAGRDVVLAAAREVVDNQDPVAGGDQRVGHV